MRFIKLSVMVLVFFAFACEDSLNSGFPGTGDGEVPILDCGGMPCPDQPSPPVPPPPPPPSRYDIGLATGKDDADRIFHDAFRIVYCESPPGLFDGNLTEEENVPGGKTRYPEYEDQEGWTGGPIDYTKIDVCYAEEFTGSRTQFNQEIIGFRALTQDKIDAGLDVDFNRGLLEGFNKRLLQYSVNYGISMP